MKFMGFNLFNETVKTIEGCRNSIFVIKCSEEASNDKKYIDAFVENIVLLRNAGVRVIIVNDGFGEVLNFINAVGYQTDFDGRYRIADNKTADAAEMILSGKINKKLAFELSSHRIKSIGISGRDNSLIKASSKEIYENSRLINQGFIGQVEVVNKKLLLELLSIGIVPVISPTGCDSSGNTYILESAYAANCISCAVSAEKLVIVENDKNNEGRDFFEKKLFSSDDGEDLDCIYSERSSFRHGIAEDNKSEVFVIENNDIGNMLYKIFPEDDPKISSYGKINFAG